MQHNSDEVPPRLERQVATLTSANNNGEIKILTMPVCISKTIFPSCSLIGGQEQSSSDIKEGILDCMSTHLRKINHCQSKKRVTHFKPLYMA